MIDAGDGAVISTGSPYSLKVSVPSDFLPLVSISSG
jgi:hypothetical protein